MVDIQQKIIKDLEKELPKVLNTRLEKEVKEVIDVGVETYEDLLLGIVTDTYSMADPENFYDEYILKLEEFKFIDDGDETISINTPDEKVFVYGGALSILQFIVEGVTGVYLELPEKDMALVLKAKGIDDKVKRRIRSLPGITDTEVPISMRFRLLHTKGSLSNTVQSILDKKLNTFPFSNSLPVDLFTPMQEYVEDNIDTWIDESVKDTIKLVKQRYN